MTINATAEVQQEVTGCDGVAGKYLTFNLGSELYGFEILKVQEIIKAAAVTRIPRTPDFVRGVINLRGKVIPVTDLRLKFGLESQEDTDRTCIIVVQVAGENGPVTTGILVDEVSEVLDITSEEIEPSPSFGAHVDTGFILGMGKVDERVISLLDIDQVISSDEMASLDKINN